jgi:2-polyprenyl-3-methyl-5-hydroxy-6-metoxy-1,4-benzoquinol methylase
MKTVLKKVNAIYSEKNPSTYLRDFNNIDKFVKNREVALLKLKLPKKIFLNSNLIDFGSGMGLNTIVYSSLGANCTLIEYDKKSVLHSHKLFKKFSKNNYKIINQDIFKTKISKKYDFVISNGVAHHTKDPFLNLKICIKSLKKGGFFILGIGETNGFFQRNLQRYILYKLAKNNNEITIFAKKLFKEHLKRSKKYSGRTIDEIIHDTYINPKINTLSLIDILKFFNKNKIDVYSFYGNKKTLNEFLDNEITQFKLKNATTKSNNQKILNLNLHDIENFSLSNNKNLKTHNRTYSQIDQLNRSLNEFTMNINDLEFGKVKNINFTRIRDLSKKIKNIKKIDIINKEHNLKFLNECYYVLKILDSKDTKKNKFLKIKKYLLKCKVLLKGLNGTGMNYIVGYRK